MLNVNKTMEFFFPTIWLLVIITAVNYISFNSKHFKRQSLTVTATSTEVLQVSRFSTILL